jgi:hypothetical protein
VISLFDCILCCKALALYLFSIVAVVCDSLVSISNSIFLPVLSLTCSSSTFIGSLQKLQDNGLSILFIISPPITLPFYSSYRKCFACGTYRRFLHSHYNTIFPSSNRVCVFLIDIYHRRDGYVGSVVEDSSVSRPERSETFEGSIDGLSSWLFLLLFS